MLLFEDYNFGFLHINKTAGTSSKEFLRTILGKEDAIIGFIPRGDGDPRLHEPLAHKVIALGHKEFNSLKVLTNIRNPYARWVSLYNARRRNYFERGKDGPHIQEAVHYEFRDWLIGCVLNRINTPPLNCSLTQYVFVNNIFPSNLFVAKVENLEYDTKTFLKSQLNIEAELIMPHKNKSKRVHFMDYYIDDYIKEAVYKHDKRIIDVFYPEFKYE